jgi:hypothetical protein
MITDTLTIRLRADRIGQIENLAGLVGISRNQVVARLIESGLTSELAGLRKAESREPVLAGTPAK